MWSSSGFPRRSAGVRGRSHLIADPWITRAAPSPRAGQLFYDNALCYSASSAPVIADQAQPTRRACSQWLCHSFALSLSLSLSAVLCHCFALRAVLCHLSALHVEAQKLRPRGTSFLICSSRRRCREMGGRLTGRGSSSLYQCCCLVSVL